MRPEALHEAPTVAIHAPLGTGVVDEDVDIVEELEDNVELGVGVELELGT